VTTDTPIEDLLGILPEIERTSDVWSWTFAGLHYWPLLRCALVGSLLQPISSKVVATAAPVSGAAVAPAATPARKSAERIGAMWAERFATLSAPVDALFLARFEDSHDMVEGLAHDRMIDPILRLARTSGYSTLKLRIARGVAASDKPLSVPAPVIRPDDDADLDLAVPALSEVDRLLEWVVDRRAGTTLTSSAVRSLIKRTIHREIVFGALLDSVKPRALFLGVFDDPMQMAAVLACRRRGILVVDIQHGKQGRDHVLCTRWENMPADGSELLPDRFWVWGEATERQVAAALGSGVSRHRPVVGGNVWLSEWKRGLHGGSDAVQALAARHARSARRLLVCLQPIADPVPPALRDALAASPKDWIWWVRLHRKQASQGDGIKEMLAATGARFEIDEPSAVPLYPLILASDCHLTGWSTVAFEAEAYGVPTVLFHPMAESIFASEIAEGRFRYARDGAGLLVAVEEAGASGRPDVPSYIVADLDVAAQRLAELLDAARPRTRSVGGVIAAFLSGMLARRTRASDRSDA
jgi:hypothetical protein